MGATHSSGPIIATGPTPNLVPVINPVHGPSMFYQGQGVPDPRRGYRNGQDSRPGTIPAFYSGGLMVLLDTSPPTLQTAGISVLAPAASGVAQTLVAALTVQTAAILVAGTGYDNGIQIFTVNSGTASTKAIVSILVVGGIPTGNVTIIGGGNYSVTPTLAGSATTGPTGSGLTLTLTVGTVSVFDNLGVQHTSLFPIDHPALPQVSGIGAFYNPKTALTRNVTVTGSASATGGNIAILGMDYYGFLMNETIAAPASATTVAGKKAYKYVISATPAFTDAGHNYSVGWGDIVGLNVRSNAFEYLTIWMNAVGITATTGWTAAVGTTQTATTGDVRGTYALQTASDGTKRLVIAQDMQVFDMLNATPVDSTTIFGTAQF